MTDNFDALADLITGAVKKNDKPSQVSIYLDTGFPPLNAAISGNYYKGLPCGRIIEIFGPESSGKTAIATAAMIAAQKMGGIAAFCDHERSFQEDLGEKNGLSLRPGQWIYKKPDTYEDSLEIFAKAVTVIRESKLIPKEAPICWVFDSLASMIPASQLGKDFNKLNMNDSSALSRLTSNTMKSVALIAEKNNVCVIFLNQTREKIGVMFGDPTTTPGGKAVKFYASVRIQLGSSPINVGTGDDKIVVGSEVTAVCKKNKINRPFMRSKWRFLFKEDGSGYFDTIGSTLDFMVKKGIIEAGRGGRVVWDGKQVFKKDAIAAIRDAGGVEALAKILQDSKVELDEDAEARDAAREEAEEESAYKE